MNTTSATHTSPNPISAVAGQGAGPGYLQGHEVGGGDGREHESLGRQARCGR